MPVLHPDLEYHRPSDAGFFSVLSFKDGPATRSKPDHPSYPLSYLPEFLERVNPRQRLYISQAEFSKESRRAVDFERVCLNFSDIDTYHSRIAHLGHTAAVAEIRRQCEDECIPEPSLISSSGRGYNAKWFLDEPVGRDDLPRWNAVQTRIGQALKDVGADPAARDISRVLRVVGTTNEKNGQRVQIVWSNEVNGTPARYDFETLFAEVSPKMPASLDERQTFFDGPLVRTHQQREIVTTLTKETLWWSRLNDLRTLVRLRQYQNGAPEGHRHNFLQIAAVALSWCVSPASLYREVAALGKEFAPTLAPAELNSAAHAAFLTTKAAWVEKNDQRLRYRNERLIELLKIQPAEMRELSTIIDDDERRRRDRDRHERRRRTAGVVPRDVYLRSAAERATRARELAMKGMTQRQIANEIGVSVGRVNAYVR